MSNFAAGLLAPAVYNHNLIHISHLAVVDKPGLTTSFVKSRQLTKVTDDQLFIHSVRSPLMQLHEIENNGFCFTGVSIAVSCYFTRRHLYEFKTPLCDVGVF